MRLPRPREPRSAVLNPAHRLLLRPGNPRVGGSIPSLDTKNPLFFLDLSRESFRRCRQLCRLCDVKFQIVGVHREMPHGQMRISTLSGTVAGHAPELVARHHRNMQCGIELITLHRLRHTFASRVIQAGLAIEETLKDSLCAEMIPKSQQSMAFGILATVNGIGDFASSVIVGILWSSVGTTVAFGYSAVLFIAGEFMVLCFTGAHDCSGDLPL